MKSKTYLSIILGFFCCLCLPACWCMAQETDTVFDISGSQTPLPQGMIATYQGGGQIEKSEWKGYLDKVSPEKKGNPNHPEDVSWKRTLLKDYVARNLIYEEALNAKLDTTPEFIKYYKFMEGLDETSEEGILIEELYTKEAREKVRVSELEMKDYYDNHKNEFTTPETISIRFIFVDTSRTRKTDSEKVEGWEKIKEAYAQLEKGKAFDSVAKKYSEDEPDRRGEMKGPFPLGTILKEIEDAARALKPGHYSGIITTQHGYNIVYLESHKLAGIQPFEEVKVNIKNTLENQQLAGLVQNILKQATENVEIIKHYEYLSISTAKAESVLIDMPELKPVRPYDGKTDEYVKPERSNGLKVTLGDFRAMQQQNPKTEDSFSIDHPTVEQEKQYLDGMVRDNMLVLYAKKLKLDRDPSVVNQIADFKQEQLVEYLLDRKIEKEVKITESDLRDYYQKNTARFMSQKEINASVIYIKADRDSWMDKSVAMKMAKDSTVVWVWGQLKKGRDFAELAKKYSSGNSAKDGGSIGWVSQGGMMGRQFDLTAFNLKPGEISNPIETRDGYQIIKVNDIRDARPKSYEEVKKDVRYFVELDTKEKLRQKILIEKLKSVHFQYDSSRL